MPTRYEAADRRTGKLIRQHAAEFQNLRLRFPLDHLNVTALKRYAKTMFSRMERRNLDAYIAIAMEIYDSLTKAEAERLVKRVLSAYDPVSGYVYTREASRKRERTVEGMISARDRASLRESIARSQRLWVAQTKQFADEVVDTAMIESYRDAGIRRMRWITVPDERRCGKCLALDRREFPINDIPAKPHPHCRCYVEPVES